MENLNPFLAMLKAKGLTDSAPCSSMTHESPLKECGLDLFHCEKCGDTGTLTRKDEEGILWSRECECMKRRRSLRNIKNADLQSLVQRYTFENYKTPTPKHGAVKKKAEEYCRSDAPAFLISGQSGSGKSHICVAAVNRLIEEGGTAEFLQWRRDAPELKAMLTDNHQDYMAKLRRLREAKNLYIDDFLKGSITPADINLAFVIINDRYNSSGRKTIVSTELTAAQLLAADEATGGRLLEMARGYVIEAPAQNWRLTPA